ncbi:SMEK domain-containing protein [[Phormidium ambiguum] IAM M-71]|nr:SMEK domain-containing protein [Phormidium ambiguum]
MNIKQSLDRISQLMSFFVCLVKAYTAQGKTDINKDAETILIPLLAEVYGYRQLINLNSKHENYPGIDLGDETARVAFQITSTSDTEKVKKTLRKFIEYKLYEKYDKLIIYNLIEKQHSYSGAGYEEIIQGKFVFDKDKHIWDFQNILKKVAYFQIDKVRKIESILEANLGEKRIPPEWEVIDKVEQIVNKYSQFFVGRSEDLQKLNKFLCENSSGITLVKAGAGFGKTALLANWISTRRNKDCCIAYHFFNHQYNCTRSVKSAYRNLLRQLYLYYNLSYEQIPDDEEQLRIRLYNLLREPCTLENISLIIVIDGLDEAENPFSPPFPTPLPKNLFVFASARAEEGEEPEYLRGWMDCAEAICLGRLCNETIKDWLRQAGEGELEAFADNAYFVSQLDEIAQGFPLYIHFLTEELIRTQQLGQDVQAVLTHSPKGFGNYVQEQFKLLARVDEIKQQREVQKLFALLSIALGMLSADDICELTNLNEWDLAALPWQATRWFNIQLRFYSFTHPLLAQEFQRILPHQVSSVKTELIAYCSRWYEHQSPYALRHYAEHLRKAKRWEELWTIARNEDFAATQQEHLPDEPDLPLKTLQTALLSGSETDNAGAMAEFLLAHAKHYMKKTVQKSPLDALQNKSLKQTLALADLYNPRICVLWYLLLAWTLKEQNKWEEASKTLEQLQHKKLPRLSDWQGDYAAYFLIYAYEINEKAFLALQKQILDWRSHLALCRNLTERGYFTIALTVTQSIDIERERIQATGEIAVALAKAGNFTEALNTIESFGEIKRTWLGKVAIEIAIAGDTDTALRTAELVHDAAEQAKILGEIAQSIAVAEKQEVVESIFNSALKKTELISNQRQKVRVIWQIASLMAKAGKREIAHSTLYTALEVTELSEYKHQQEWEYEIGEIAAAFGIAQEYKKALELTEKIKDKSLNSLALVNIVKAIARAGNFALAQETAKQIRDRVQQARALGKIVKAVARSGDFTAALEILQQISNELHYTEALVEIVEAMAMSGDFTAALKTTSRIYHYGARARALRKIAMIKVATGDKQAAIFTFKTALEKIMLIENKLQMELHEDKRALEILEKNSILGLEPFAQIIEKSRAKSIVKEEDFAPAFEKAYQLYDERHKAWALAEIAQIMASLGLGEQAVKTAKMILINQHFFLPRVALIFAQTGDKENFKQLLIPCAYYLYAANQMGGLLAPLYPEQAATVAKVMSEFR